MANKKVTDLTAYSSIKTTDTYHVVDTTDTSQDASGSSYKVDVGHVEGSDPRILFCWHRHHLIRAALFHPTRPRRKR